MTPSESDPIVAEQIRYYRARAPEYDEWFERQGRFDQGAEANARWFAELEELRAALRAEQPPGAALELACGTGHWTRQLVERASEVLAVDASPEVIAINRGRVGSPGVQYQCADLFTWKPDRRFAFVFFGFWLSHVPAARFDAFWEMVRSSSSPGGRFFFADNLSPSTRDRRGEVAAGSERITRRLNDGREFDIVKHYFEPSALEARLESLGFEASVRHTERYFLFGSGATR